MPMSVLLRGLQGWMAGWILRRISPSSLNRWLESVGQYFSCMTLKNFGEDGVYTVF